MAVYSTAAAYFTGFLILLITWHLKRQKTIKAGSIITSSSIAIGKMVAVLIESSIVESDNSLGVLFLCWAVAALLLLTIFFCYAVLKPMHEKMTLHAKRNLGP